MPLARPRDRLELGMAPEPAKNVPDVVSHRRLRQAQPNGDLPRTHSFRHEVEHFALARTELNVEGSGHVCYPIAQRVAR